MKKQRNVNLLLMLVLLVAVGQMAQTIYIPAIADMAKESERPRGRSTKRDGSLSADLWRFTAGLWPLSDRVGRRPVILVGHEHFHGSDGDCHHHAQPDRHDCRQRPAGCGTGVGGVMARTLPRDMYQGTQLRHANSLLNMGILVSPLLAR